MDAKQILDVLMGAGARQQPGGGSPLDAILGQVLGGGAARAPAPGAAPQGGGGLGDLLGQVLGGGGGQPQPGQPPQGGGGLGDILGQVLGGGRGQPQPGQPPQGGGGLADILGQVLGGGRGQPQPGQPPQGGGGLGDILGQVLGGGRGQPQPSQPPQGGGGLGDILGQVLGGGRGQPQQQPHGDPMGDVLGRGRTAEPAPGGGGLGLDQILGQLGGPGGLEKLKELIAQNPGLAAILGGAGALAVGTKTGRSVAKQAVVLGGLALVGALAYRAYAGWQNGEAPRATAAATAQIEKAPDGSGFDGGGDENEQQNTALIMLKAMIGAAAADGRLDEKEKSRLMGNFNQMQLGDDAKAFIQQELAKPASPEEIAEFGTTPEMAAQIYTAARLVIDLDTGEEKVFLKRLADSMGLDAELVAHIEAAAAGMAS